AEQMVRHIEATKQVIAEHNRVQAALAAHAQYAAQQQWQAYVRDQDAKYDDFSSGFSKEQNAEITNEVIAMFQEAGMGREEIRRMWNTNPTIRSFPAQVMMYQAARFRISQRAMASKVARPVLPVVQRPGVAAERIPESDVQIDRLNSRLNKTGNYRDA